jgi:hypothetical protein
MPCLKSRSGANHAKQENRKARRQRLASERLHAIVETGRVPLARRVTLPGTVDRVILAIKI